jgi:(p)ppGpp synthase/HD superfamily hydrolase
MVPLGEPFERALIYAHSVHALQVRKGTRIPYVSHLLAVAGLVMEDGGSETEVIAALLHDAAEDQGGEPGLEDIRRRFGDEVAAIVDGCLRHVRDPQAVLEGAEGP